MSRGLWDSKPCVQLYVHSAGRQNLIQHLAVYNMGYSNLVYVTQMHLVYCARRAKRMFELTLRTNYLVLSSYQVLQSVRERG